MYDLSRLKGLIVAASVVTLALVGFSVLAIATAGGRPSWLSRGDSTIEGGQERVVGSRIVGVSKRVRSGEDLADLGVILGASAVGMGIDPKILEADAGPAIPGHWLSLYANGANLADLRDLAELLFQSGLSPRILVLGLHPGLLARSDDYLSDRISLDATAFRKELASKHLIAAKEELEALSAIPLNWAFPNRTRISNLTRGLTSSAKRRLFARLGMDASALYPAEADPWRVKLLVEDADEPDREAAAEGRAATVRDQAEGPMREGMGGPVKDKGWTNPDAYPLDGDNPQALIALIREARTRGIEVVVLLLPESTKLRASIPPQAMANLKSALVRGFEPALPELIDLRETISDREFHDSIHPNKAGRESTTRQLAKALRNRKRAERP
jgi:hypothetical protein